MMHAVWLAAVLVGLVGSPGPPAHPTVAVYRVKDFLLPLGPLTPPVFYPEGKVSEKAVRRALCGAIATMGGKDPIKWCSEHFKPAERIGIQVDCSWPPVTMLLVDVLIDELVRSGANPDQIYVFAGDERDIFRAGLIVRKQGDGVKVIGTASEGFRGGLSRVVLDYCDALINVSRLRADARIGLWGCVANHLACVDYPKRIEALKDPEKLCQIAARPTVRLKMRLHILDALQPIYEPASGRRKLPPRWQYGGIIASQDPVAADLVGWRLLEAYREKKFGKPAPLEPQPTYLFTAPKYRLSVAKFEAIRLKLAGYLEDALLEPREPAAN